MTWKRMLLYASAVMNPCEKHNEFSSLRRDCQMPAWQDTSGGTANAAPFQSMRHCFLMITSVTPTTVSPGW